MPDSRKSPDGQLKAPRKRVKSHQGGGVSSTSSVTAGAVSANLEATQFSPKEQWMQMLKNPAIHLLTLHTNGRLTFGSSVPQNAGAGMTVLFSAGNENALGMGISGPALTEGDIAELRELARQRQIKQAQ